MENNTLQDLSIVLCDDEPSGLSVLKQLLNSNNINNITCFSNPTDALNYLLKNTVDVAFLDIKMPKLNGIDLASKLANLNTLIIFITAYKEFAVQAFNVTALDYLTKPVSPTRLLKSLHKVEQQLLIKPITILQKNQYEFIIKEKNQLIPLTNTEIQRIEAADKYSVIHTFSGNHVYRKSLSEIEKLLQSDFVRIHRSTIINLNCIYKVANEKRKWIVVTTDGLKLPVSESYRKKLLALL